MKNFRAILWVFIVIMSSSINAQDKKITWKNITENKDESFLKLQKPKILLKMFCCTNAILAVGQKY